MRLFAKQEDSFLQKAEYESVRIIEAAKAEKLKVRGQPGRLSFEIRRVAPPYSMP